MLNPNSAHTRPEGENSEKKFKKIQKIKKQLSVVIFSKNGTRQDEIGRETEKLIFDPNSSHSRRGGDNRKKKNAKKLKKLKNNLPVLVVAKTELDRMRQAKKEIKEC